MKKSTSGLFMAVFAFVLAGGANQAVAMQKCSPVGGCVTGTKCGKDGLWHADKSCATTISGAGGGGSQAEIFDRWGKMKTKASCETGGGIWAGEDGKGSCTERRK